MPSENTLALTSGNYTKTTDFAAKDSLPSGDSGKIIKGAEFETEFDSISTAVATKADIASPTFTGTVYGITVNSADIIWTYYASEESLPSAASNHGMFAHVHSTGAAYYAHAGAWYRLANQVDLNLKAPIASPIFTGTVSGIDATMVGLANVNNTTDANKPISSATQTALDLNFDGLMIETHFDPDNAWSDAAQQVTPTALVQIMKDLKIRKESSAETDYNVELNTLRTQIDVIDNQLIEILSKRMKVADAIGGIKKSQNVAVLQSNRWNEILGKMILEGEAKGLSEEFVLKMFKAIHQESINHQEKILKA